MIAAAPLLGMGSHTASAACPNLTPADLMSSLSAGTMAFKLDDEGYAATPLYLDLLQVAANGTVSGTISTSSVAPSSGVFYQISGTVSGAGTLAISFTYATGSSRLLDPSYSYSGAITFADQSCDQFIAGTYTSTSYRWVDVAGRLELLGVTAGPFPFSGKVVGYQYY
jgi:hypothetical protein